MNPSLGVKGRYKVMTCKAGLITKELPWFSNLLTNYGMDYFATGNSPFIHCWAGSANTPPQYTDVVLGNTLGVSNVTNPILTVDTTNNIVKITATYTFPAGRVVGNVAELGVSPSAAINTYGLISRTLVKDALGNPTAIPVQSDEDLVVVYEFQIIQPTQDFPFTLGPHTGVIRAANINNLNNISCKWGDVIRIFLVHTSTDVRVYTGPMGTVTGGPSTPLRTISMNVSGAYINTPYVAGTHTRTVIFTFPADFEGSMKSFTWELGTTCWQMELDSPITKQSAQTFKLGAVISWARA